MDKLFSFDVHLNAYNINNRGYIYDMKYLDNKLFEYDQYVDFRTLNFKEIIDKITDNFIDYDRCLNFKYPIGNKIYKNLIVRVFQMTNKKTYMTYTDFDYKLRITPNNIIYYYTPNDDLKMIRKNNKGIMLKDCTKLKWFYIDEFNYKFKEKVKKYMETGEYELALSALKKIVPNDDYKLEIKSLENKIKNG